MKESKVIFCQLMSVIAIFCLASTSAADFYEDNNIRRPQPGEVVCRVMVDEFSVAPFNRYDICENDCQSVVLPVAHCQRHAAIDGSFGWGRKLRVASVGDQYILQNDTGNETESGIMTAENSTEVCNARVVDPESEQVLTLRHLESQLCFAGAEFVYLDGEETRQARVEVALDFYLVESEEVQVAQLLDSTIETGGPERVLPATYSRSTEIEI